MLRLLVRHIASRHYTADLQLRRALCPQVLCILFATVTVLAYAVNGNEFLNESLPDQECESVPVSATKVR